MLIPLFIANPVLSYDIPGFCKRPSAAAIASLTCLIGMKCPTNPTLVYIKLGIYRHQFSVRLLSCLILGQGYKNAPCSTVLCMGTTQMRYRERAQTQQSVTTQTCNFVMFLATPRPQASSSFRNGRFAASVAWFDSCTQ